MDYKDSGVDIEAGNQAVNQIKSHVQKTFNPLVLNHLGGYASMFELPKGYENPVLVSCTDGVGTKLKLAIETEVFDTLGIDLVAMCVNDLICTGAKPLYFLDYIACHKLDPDHIEQIIAGMTNGCLQSDCALVGGEMAEMNDLYRPRDFDLAGFSVGVVEKRDVLDGTKIKPGNKVYGLASSGAHSNGFSLIRKIVSLPSWVGTGITKEDLLEPTKIYVKDIDALKASGVAIHGLAHITGGGLAENVNRILPDNVTLKIKKGSWPVPNVFKQLQKVGAVSEDEMFRVFNMGLGMIVVTDDQSYTHPNLIPLGEIEAGEGGTILV